MCLCCVAPSQGPTAWLKLQKCWCLLSTACLELVAVVFPCRGSVFPTKNGFPVEQKPQGESLSLCHSWETAHVFLSLLQELAAACIRSVMVTGNPAGSSRGCGAHRREIHSSSILHCPSMGILGCHCAMADVKSLPLYYPRRGQPADSCHGGQESGYDSHMWQSHPHQCKRTRGLHSSFHCLAIGRRLQSKHSCSPCKHSQGWLLLGAGGINKALNV